MGILRLRLLYQLWSSHRGKPTGPWLYPTPNNWRVGCGCLSHRVTQGRGYRDGSQMGLSYTKCMHLLLLP